MSNSDKTMRGLSSTHDCYNLDDDGDHNPNSLGCEDNDDDDGDD